MLLRNLCLLLFLLNTLLVFGGKNTWLGDAYSHSDPVNWSLGYTPTPSDSIFIFVADSGGVSASILAQRIEIKRSTLVHLGNQISANAILIQVSTIQGTRSILSGQRVGICGKNQGNQIHQVLRVCSESFRARKMFFMLPSLF
ncbi:MAG: hypothetical protein ACJAY8_000729 [Sphingobacteriales bacterium]|jgi:hypothetical protein